MDLNLRAWKDGAVEMMGDYYNVLETLKIDGQESDRQESSVNEDPVVMIQDFTKAFKSLKTLKLAFVRVESTGSDFGQLNSLSLLGVDCVPEFLKDFTSNKGLEKLDIRELIIKDATDQEAAFEVDLVGTNIKELDVGRIFHTKHWDPYHIIIQKAACETIADDNVSRIVSEYKEKTIVFRVNDSVKYWLMSA